MRVELLDQPDEFRPLTRLERRRDLFLEAACLWHDGFIDRPAFIREAQMLLAHVEGIGLLAQKVRARPTPLPARDTVDLCIMPVQGDIATGADRVLSQCRDDAPLRDRELEALGIDFAPAHSMYASRG